MITTLRITGMSCNNCVRHVGTALRGVPGVAGVDVSLPDGVAKVSHEQPIDQALQIVAKLG